MNKVASFIILKEKLILLKMIVELTTLYCHYFDFNSWFKRIKPSTARTNPTTKNTNR